MTWNLSIKTGLFVCVLLLCLSSGAEPGPARKLRLFDGKSFQGWEGDTDKTFRIQEGAVVAGSLSAKVPRNEFLCTRKSYKNFVLRVKFKLLGTGANAGVQIRSKRIPNHHEVIGYQADMGDPEWWGCLYDESRRKKVLAKADLAAVNKVLKRNDWNEYVIRCEGKRIQLSINGLQTVDYAEPEDSIEQDGVICLQIHGGPPREAWYKDVSIEELP
jgi:3-keto-disaccharide hydrolase